MSKAFVAGTIPAASARGCSELLHPHVSQSSPSPLLRAVGTLRITTATLSRAVAQMPRPTGLTEVLR